MLLYKYNKRNFLREEKLMGKKVLVVGGVAGGATVAVRQRRLDEHSEIIMFEKGPNISFSNCALPYYLSDVVDTKDKLIIMDPVKMYNQFRIESRVFNEVTKIDREKKEVEVKNLQTGETYRESYDKLVLSPGASPVVPPFEGLDKVNYFTVRNVDDIVRLKTFIEKKARNVSVIGGGFIGIEVAENLKDAGYNVTLIEAMNQVMQPFDYDMVQTIHKEIYDNGIELLLEDPVDKFEENTVVLGSGKKIPADAVVMAIGVRPETKLAEEAGLEIGETRSIKVDHNYLTNDKDIYAIGDAIEVHHKLTGKITRLALAGPAHLQARAVADHMNGKSVRQNGVIATSAIKVFSINGASTGLNEKMLANMDISYDVAKISARDKIGPMPDSEMMHLKVIFEKPSGRILGAQALGKGNVDKRIDVIATVIHFNGNLEDLKELELSYAPPFGTANDIVNIAGMTGLNILENAFKQVPVSEVRRLVEEGAFIVDVRGKAGYDSGHIKGAINIPLGEFRDRMDEIPKDQPVYFHCGVGKQSYNVLLALQQRGYDNLINIAGGYIGLSHYEYFRNRTTDQENIMTGYMWMMG